MYSYCWVGGFVGGEPVFEEFDEWLELPFSPFSPFVGGDWWEVELLCGPTWGEGVVLGV